MAHTLLLADDSVTIQRVIALTFADEDVNVIVVGDGEQAIAVLNDQPPDIVLADVGMPNRDGYDVAQHIRITPALAHIPVVLLTGAFEPVDEARAALVGVDAVLAKPFEPQFVIAKVKELLARPRRATASMGPAQAPSEPIAKKAEPIEPPAPVEPVQPPVPVGAVEPPATVEPPVVASAAAPVEDDYFDRLDQAFASLAEAPRPLIDPLPHVPASQDLADRAAAEPPLDLAAAPMSAAGPEAGTPFPTLSDAFAALLDAEQDASSPDARPVWPSAQRADGVAAIGSDALVERVTHDVLERLSDRAVKEAVSDIVSSVAERMVRDEIDRIKASIRS